MPTCASSTWRSDRSEAGRITMAEDKSSRHPTLALNTKVEEGFISPLTALRGALEILRDHADLPEDRRRRFIETALGSCAQLEQSVDELADAVYAAGAQSLPYDDAQATGEGDRRFRDRIRFLDDIDTVEIDLSEFEFSSSEMVNAFHDAIDHAIAATGKRWYILVNYTGCSIWPEAWVAFAHRGTQVNAAHSLGTVRYSTPDSDAPTRGENYDPNLFDSRDAALAKIEEMKRSAGT